MLTKGGSSAPIFIVLAIAGIVGFLIYQNPKLVAQLQLQNIPGITQLFPNPEPSPFVETYTPVSEEMNPTPNPDQSGLYQKCDRQSCLFVDTINSAPIGYGKLTGYYTTYEAEAWGEKSTCEAFVVTNGNPTLVDHFNSLIQSGNRVNTVIDGKLVLNLSFNNVESNILTAIKSSSSNNPIEIGVISPTQPGRGAPVCYSFLEIISAK